MCVASVGRSEQYISGLVSFLPSATMFVPEATAECGRRGPLGPRAWRARGIKAPGDGRGAAGSSTRPDSADGRNHVRPTTTICPTANVWRGRNSAFLRGNPCERGRACPPFKAPTACSPHWRKHAGPAKQHKLAAAVSMQSSRPAIHLRSHHPSQHPIPRAVRPHCPELFGTPALLPLVAAPRALLLGPARGWQAAR